MGKKVSKAVNTVTNAVKKAATTVYTAVVKPVVNVVAEKVVEPVVNVVVPKDADAINKKAEEAAASSKSSAVDAAKKAAEEAAKQLAKQQKAERERQQEAALEAIRKKEQNRADAERQAKELAEQQAAAARNAVLASIATGKTHNVNIPKKSVIPNVGNTHEFYGMLQNSLNDKTRGTYVINNPVCQLKCGDPSKLTNSYNVGGDLYLSCYLPFNSSTTVPNYAEIIMNETNKFNTSDVLLKILLTWLTDANALTEFVTSKATNKNNTISKSISNADMKTDIMGGQQKNVYKNWNVGREKWDIQKVNLMRNFFANKFNDLIDYVITNDVTVADNDFKTKWLSLFVNTGGALYSYSNGTLMVPSLINWFSTLRNDGYDALVMCGYVPAGSKIFPINGNNELNRLASRTLRCWWDKNSANKTKETLDENSLYVPFDVNGGLSTVGNFNFPFTSNDYNSTVNRAKVETSYLGAVTVLPNNNAYKQDNYYYKDVVCPGYATLVLGEYKLDSSFRVAPYTIDKTKDGVNIRVPLKRFRDAYNVNLTTECDENNQSSTRSKAVIGTKTLTYKTAKCNSRTINGFRVRLDPDRISDADAKEYLRQQFADFKKMSGEICASDNPKNSSSINSSRKFTGGFLDEIKYDGIMIKKMGDQINPRAVADNKIANLQDYDTYTSTDGSTVIKTSYEYKKDLYFGNLLGTETVTASECANANTLRNSGTFNYCNFDDSKSDFDRYVNIKFKATYNKFILSGWYKVWGSTYGETSRIYTESPSAINDESFNCQQRLMCHWKTNKTLYWFNSNVFDYWIKSLEALDNCQLALNALRDYIKAHPALIAVNKANAVFKSIIKKSMLDGGNGDVSFIGLPLGAPLVYIQKTLLLDYKFYHPTYEFKQIANVNDEYNPNVINSVKVDTAEAKKNNLLDVIFGGIISNSLVTGEPITDDTYFAILIPNKGQNLLDVISYGMGELIFNDIAVVRAKFSDTNKMTSPVHDYSYGKIILSFKSFNTQSGNIFALLSTSYKFIDSVYVPYIGFHHTSGSAYVEIRINTLSDEKPSEAENKSKEPNDYPEGYEDTTKTNTSNGVIDIDNGAVDVPAITTPTDNDTGTSATPPTVGTGMESFDNSKFITSNRMYIYVSNINYQDFTSMLHNDKKDSNGVNVPMLTIRYRGLDAMFPSQCLQLTKIL